MYNNTVAEQMILIEGMMRIQMKDKTTRDLIKTCKNIA